MDTALLIDDFETTFDVKLVNTYTLNRNCVSENHLTNVLELLKQVHADQYVIQVYISFFAIQQYPQHKNQFIEYLKINEQTLIRDLLKINQSEWLTNPQSRNTEALRRLLLALIHDVRAVLILLAEQLVLMRNATTFPTQQQKQLANSAFTYHAPLANRLGIWQLKWELEDLSFRFLQPDEYRNIAHQLDEKRKDRETFISQCISELEQQLNHGQIKADIAGRPKHIYSIYRKMQKKNLSFNNLFDVRAVRVLVNSVTDCYAALGVVHSTWKHIPKEFDDYIAQPKGNRYQSLHTVVMSQGKTLEVQIRTHQMHEHAELGVAAHWRYKDGSKQDEAYDEKVNWMRQLLNDESQDQDLLAQFASETQEDRVYVFTPNGDVIDLPYGSTPVDFAYHVHTEIGHRCQGAKIDGAIVSLTYVLQTGNRVEILTAKEPNPSRGWLREQSGYLHTAGSRAKVRHWFRQNEFDKNLASGKEILEAELKKYALEKADLTQLLRGFNLQDIDRLHAMIGTGDISVNQVIRKAELQLNPQKPKTAKTGSQNKTTAISKDTENLFLIDGIGSLKTTIASCCQPVLGDTISGFITRTRGISIHSSSCSNLHHMINEEPTRLIQVSWKNSVENLTSAHLLIETLDRKNFIKELSAILANTQANIDSLNTTYQSETGRQKIELSIQVNDFDHLSRIIDRISVMEQLISIRRIQ